MNKYSIPKYIDEPTRIVIFTVDEIVLIGIIMFMSFYVGYELLGLVTSTVAYLVYKKLKGNRNGSNLKKLAYWKFRVGKNNGLPSSAIRKYKG